MRCLESPQDREITGPFAQPLLDPWTSATIVNLCAQWVPPGLADSTQQTTESSLWDTEGIFSQTIPNTASLIESKRERMHDSSEKKNVNFSPATNMLGDLR